VVGEPLAIAWPDDLPSLRAGSVAIPVVTGSASTKSWSTMSTPAQATASAATLPVNHRTAKPKYFITWKVCPPTLFRRLKSILKQH
jgi:hypothetical protein